MRAARRRQIAAGALAAAVVTAGAAFAQSPADFYRGKTVRIMIAGAPGAAYDFVGRALAAHMGRHIPGNPSMSVENVPGAASLVLLNNTYNRAARDGTVFSLPLNGVVLEPRLKVLSREGGAVGFDRS
jgi:tripartite-type tricarboxylate transporter receptor subunit TctC